MISVISVDHELTFDQVKKSLLELFPDFVIFASDPEIIYPKEINWKRLDHVWLQLDFDEAKKDFPYYITVESGGDNEDERRGLHIARKISKDYNTRTLTGYDHPDYDDKQYSCALFDNSKTYLVDTYFDYPMDDKRPARGIEILMEIEIPYYRFDSTGDFIEIVTKEAF